ncbi:variable surface lipoprotein [Metamycoplasma auris]|uniref:Lipoprotein n=1 Tax=Metamycoplasma auris TaxID=51363 RepID=A0A2W7G212_9BACT|nr:variable surface lipoprotein [Metamycoplasma auris]PZV99973.1 hypothetical protein BCF89_10452 [Metamycoplasma auris]
MKKINKILFSLGSVASLVSLPLVAANCNGTNKQNEEKSPAKNPEKNPDKNKEGETSTTTPATNPETNTPKEKSQEEKALAASTYIYEVWGRDIYKYQSKTNKEPKKVNEFSIEDILKKQKANEEKATNANLVPKKIDPNKESNSKLVNGWLNSLKSLN